MNTSNEIVAETVRNSSFNTGTNSREFVQDIFQKKVDAHWTPERLRKLTSGKKLAVLPTTAPLLLRGLGLLNKDASMSADAVRKFLQINHLLQQLETHLQDLNERFSQVRILDAGCGSSFLTFLLGWAYQKHWRHAARLIGVDHNERLINKNKALAQTMGLADLISFYVADVAAFNWFSQYADEPADDATRKTNRPHAVIALHACDSATDHAISLGIRLHSDFIAVAPCCQAELAKQWKDLGNSQNKHPLAPIWKNPHLRREVAAGMTDMLRVLWLRAHGYEVTTTEFTMSHATPKNTLILATRRGQYSVQGRNEHQALKEYLGHSGLAYEDVER